MRKKLHFFNKCHDPALFELGYQSADCDKTTPVCLLSSTGFQPEAWETRLLRTAVIRNSANEVLKSGGKIVCRAANVYSDTSVKDKNGLNLFGITSVTRWFGE